MGVDIRPVQGRLARHRFVDFPFRVFGNDPSWVPPLIVLGRWDGTHDMASIAASRWERLNRSLRPSRRGVRRR